MILEEIANKTRERIEQKKKEIPLETLREQALAMDANTGFPFKQALQKKQLSFICEVKKASPSKGVIAKNFPFLDIAKSYEEAGGDALSVLTEPFYFQGADEFLEEISKEVSIPIIRKDFTIDAYMIYEAKIMGASAVLLICAILSKEQIKEYLELAHSLGLSAIVEAHDYEEVKIALGCGAEIIGVNNRNLKDFTVDIQNSIRLRKQVPNKVIFVSESGMKTAADIAALRENGTDAVLIGETLMRSTDKRKTLQKLRG